MRQSINRLAATGQRFNLRTIGMARVAIMCSLTATALACDGADGVTGNDTDRSPRLTNHIVFATCVEETDNWDIHTIDLDTNERTVLTNGPEVDQYPSVSPDGSLIAFSRRMPNADGTFRDFQIYVMKADGSDPRPLTTMPGSQPAWSPDGRRIAFRATDAAGLTEIWAMAADGSDLEQLSTGANPSAGNSQPTWSPDGSKIAYVFTQPTSPGSMLFVMDADGSDPVDLLGGFTEARSPVWSPDGSHIAYSTLTSGGRVISQVRTDGSGRLDLTAGPSDDFPSWSPDGTKIAFARTITGSGALNTDIVVSTVNVTSVGDMTQNLTLSPALETMPHWVAHQ